MPYSCPRSRTAAAERGQAEGSRMADIRVSYIWRGVASYSALNQVLSRGALDVSNSSPTWSAEYGDVYSISWHCRMPSG